MKNIEWGRKKKPVQKKKSSPDLAGTAAVVCAVICAFSLCAFTIRGDFVSDMGQDAVAVFANTSDIKITYTPPEEPEDWSIWGYFSNILSEVFGVNS